MFADPGKNVERAPSVAKVDFHPRVGGLRRPAGPAGKEIEMGLGIADDTI
jgi:hypothetical protein